MNDFSVCVACLSTNNRVHHVKNTHYYEIYESLANLSLNLESGIPDTVCFICYSQLLKCYKFMEKAQESGRKLTQLLQNTDQLTQELVLSLDKKVTTNLVTTTLKPSSFLPGDCQESVKTEEMEKAINDCPMKGIINTMTANEDKPRLNLKEEPAELDVQEEMVIIKEEYIVSTEPAHYEYKPVKQENDTEIEKEAIGENQVDNKETNDNSHLKIQYIKKVRKDKTSHVCATCGIAFSSKSYLNRHERMHTGEKPFACNICNKTFAQNGHLHQHMRLHTGERPFTCHICKNKSFNHRYNYKTHMRKHFGVPMHKCDMCTSVFHQKADLKRHVMTHTGEKPYACEICNTKFSQSGHLKQHIRMHSKYTCTICDVSFSQKSEFNNHLTTHTGIKQYICHMPECNKAYNRQSTLSNHLKTHFDDRPYKCNVCCKTFKENEHLTKHNNKIHDKTKNLKKNQNKSQYDQIESEHNQIESNNKVKSLQNQGEPRLIDTESQQTPKVVVAEIAQNHDYFRQDEDVLLEQRYLQEQEEYIIP